LPSSPGPPAVSAWRWPSGSPAPGSTWSWPTSSSLHCRPPRKKIAGLGGKTLAVPTDVSDEAAVNTLAAAAVDRFGAVHVVCNNAGVASLADPWFGPLSAWKWVLGVNLWGVIHGIRAFLPVLAAQGEGHIVNTASVAGLVPGIGPSYDAAKHAVVAISEDLYQAMNVAMLPVGVSVLCPGWVRTSIAQADRNWSQSLGEVPARAATAEVTEPHVQRAIDEGMAPAAVADLVADAITANRFWVFTDPHFTQMALDRWQRIAEGHNPQTDADMPGLPPAKQLIAEIQQLLAGPGGALWLPGGPGPQADGTPRLWAWPPLVLTTLLPTRHAARVPRAPRLNQVELVVHVITRVRLSGQAAGRQPSIRWGCCSRRQPCRAG
jgi:NAD(P)-dependent dehydrogenase (short-subunit alcohol dehydrogenase family)